MPDKETNSVYLSAQTLASLTDDVNGAVFWDQDTDPCPHSRDIKDEIAARNRDLLLTQHEGRADMSIVVEVERAFGWPRLWDLTLDNGAKCVEGLRNLVRVITFPSHAMQACPLCLRDEISRDSLLCHVLDTPSLTHTHLKKLLSPVI